MARRLPRPIPAPFVILAALLLPAAETALLLGLLIPGELAVVVAVDTRRAAACPSRPSWRWRSGPLRV
ncbi:MAG: hypothetical protein ABI968_07385 [Acidobacteriota bacterium]